MDIHSDERQRKISYLAEFDESTSENENENTEEQEEIYGWDLFRSFPTKSKSGSAIDNTLYERILQIIKSLTYLIIFTMVLGGNILSKCTILLMTSQIGRKEPLFYCEYNEPEKRPEERKLLVIIPEEGRLTKYPGIFDIFFNCLIDGIHVTALVILFLIVIPQYNSIQAVIIISSMCFIPTLLSLLSRNRQQGSFAKFIFMICGDVTILIIQIGIILTFSLLSSDIDSKARWMLPFSLILSSCRWWSNYISPKCQIKFIRFLWQTKERLELSRGILQGISAIWRMLVFFFMSIIIINWQEIEIDKYFQSFPGVIIYNVTLNEVRNNSDEIPEQKPVGVFTTNSTTLFIILLINGAASFLSYSASKFSSQTLMQRFGFALPSILTLPITLVLIFSLSFLRWENVCAMHEIMPDYIFFNSPQNSPGIWSEWQYWIWFLQLLSCTWTTVHIWMPHCERLATADRIFAVPSYDSLIVDQSLMLNRRKYEAIDDTSDQNFVRKNMKNYSDYTSGNSSTEIKSSDRVTKVYACATMWHELEAEMELFINSILRLDLHQSAMRFTQKRYKIQVDDYFELETHIFFDDAFQCMHGCEDNCDHDENETHVNDYVKSLIETMKSSVERMGMLPIPPMKYPAPYGGRLEWLLPGQTHLIVHLKDKNKIRHRKRWSQVMYMYYLLGYRLIDQPIHINRKATIAENTYILTLDGDIDFRPTAVKVLLHLMKRDKELGAACGRIHPIGTGPMVWFQKFEYAIGHWLQKSTEHTIGSVLCSPGCFSLFRAKALMEDNVMRKYATRSTDARHYIQYDQGEDRWLCTLILQSGYRVEYSAASDSYTHAPETFNEFYNQRRRWIPSTIANIFDLLNSSKETRKVNENISWLYVAYQWALMGSTILGPGTIFLMLIGALVAAFRIDNWTSLYYNIIPITIFVIVCFVCKPKTQLIVAAVISAYYGLVMIVVLVGIMIQIAEDGWVAPSTILFFVVASQIVIAGLLHPQEWSCLLCGIIYYVTVPSMYMLLIIYSIFNVHDVTWGTRESRIPLTQKIGFEINEDELIKPSNDPNVINTKGSIDFSLAGLFRCMLCTQNQQSDEMNKLEIIAKSLNQISSRLNALEENSEIKNNQVDDNCNEQELCKQFTELNNDEEYNKICDDNLEVNSNASCVSINETVNNTKSINFLVNPHWIQDPDIRKGGIEFLSREEELFWNRLIKKYLYPLDMDKRKIEKMEDALKKLRNENIFKFFMLNALFVLTVLLMQLNKETLHLEWPLGTSYNITYRSDMMEVHLAKDYLQLEPIGCLFIGGFLAILFIQFIAMLFHRYNTFLHLLSNTHLKLNCCTKAKDLPEDKVLETHVKDIVDGLQRLAEENGIADWKQAQLSRITSPKKRQTVHTLIENHDKKQRAPTNFHTVFRQNLSDNPGNSRLTSTGISQNLIKALNRRRTTLIAKQKDAPQQEKDTTTINKNGNSSKNCDNEKLYTYHNRAFVDDDSDDVKNGILSRRHSQVKFSNINENV
ncbi:hypothetical protein PV327_006282 [Microctonus hyperodae]|uniref:chitin synthase n=1 Tax=Microctonus hyperodae TaxID=165561 RepID=A0AA39F3Y3_MICHY|nr:hypothetical protein PV327_006282 [Microctonus hyperodae]